MPKLSVSAKPRSHYPVIGIDPSTRMGVCWGEGTGPGRWKSVLLTFDDRRHRIRRWIEYVKAVESILRKESPVLAVVEGYSYGNPQRAHMMGEIGGLLRYTLEVWKIPTVEVPPTQLKKYVTGRGTAKKNEVLLGVYKNFGPEFKDDNLADAFALYQLGHRLISQDGRPYGQAAMDVVARVRELNEHALSNLKVG